MSRPDAGCFQLLATIALMTFAQGERLAADDVADHSPLARVEIFAAGETTRMDLWMEVGGEPLAARFERTRRRYVESLFARLDRDADGRLSEAEAAAAPPPQLALPDSVPAGEADSVHVAFNFRAVDVNRDGHATSEEFLEFYSYFGDGPLRLRTVPANAELLVRLHETLLSKLDSDGDGTVDVPELNRARDLAALDRDGDEVLTASELLPPSAADETLAMANASGDFRLRRSRTGMDEGISLVVIFPPAGHTGQPVLIYTGVKSPLPAAGTLRLATEALAIDVEVVTPPLRVLERARRVLTLEFDGADADGNDRVARDDRIAEFLSGEFEVLDSDGDATITTRDVREYADGLLTAEDEFRASQITLRLLEAGGGLFALLDANGDGRFSQRELSSAPGVVATYDRNSDGRLEADEMNPPHRLLIQRGTLQVPYATGTARAPGPAWFSRMDRNRDGDVSRGEFLGPALQFDELDADRDGWIDLEEALRVERRSSEVIQDGI
ncbi:transaldolase/EF-hand domain-containing protein [Maioricimonas rarisocia]|uniref:Transaldolase/EF-hand domain-containing protein n=1 Tax=Maioricimonas rarisocia TaxID=2528026 RepID=A0A517Z4Y5_9PLAN|nr:hypothetical protein [Maioricimonas rarisocia]QDU37509.1 transaldolase/EF-hand domain-containing protein [Maioricimonas rarisocia]